MIIPAGVIPLFQKWSKWFQITLDYSLCADERMRKYGEEDISYLPLACYQLRWNIEVSYYEGKTFWSLEE